jgi:hypothetical protein
MQKCIGVSKTIITSVYRHLSSDMEAEGNPSKQHKNPLNLARICVGVWQSGLILLYVASEGYYQEGIAQSYPSSYVVSSNIRLQSVQGRQQMCFNSREPCIAGHLLAELLCSCDQRASVSLEHTDERAIPRQDHDKTFLAGALETHTMRTSRGETSTHPTLPTNHQYLSLSMLCLSQRCLPQAHLSVRLSLNRTSTHGISLKPFLPTILKTAQTCLAGGVLRETILTDLMTFSSQ